MRDLGNGYYLDSDGRLYVTRPGTPDPFDPPGTIAPDVITATHFTFEDTPTYGWPLGEVYANNPLQFATADTADKVLARVRLAFPGIQAAITLDEATVGPFTRQAIRQITTKTHAGKVANLNAGLLAVKMAERPGTWHFGMQLEVETGGAPTEIETGGEG